jgi:hypothetical protein
VIPRDTTHKQLIFIAYLWKIIFLKCLCNEFSPNVFLIALQR